MEKVIYFIKKEVFVNLEYIKLNVRTSFFLLTNLQINYYILFNWLLNLTK